MEINFTHSVKCRGVLGFLDFRTETLRRGHLSNADALKLHVAVSVVR